MEETLFPKEVFVTMEFGEPDEQGNKAGPWWGANPEASAVAMAGGRVRAGRYVFQEEVIITSTIAVATEEAEAPEPEADCEGE